MVGSDYVPPVVQGPHDDSRGRVVADPHDRFGQYTGTIPSTPPIDPQSVPPSYVTGPTDWSSQNAPYEPNDWSAEGAPVCCPPGSDTWGWRLLPAGLVWKAYLAGRKESRFASTWANESMAHDLWQGGLWDITLGGRAGILRYGSSDEFRPEGFQVDIEGAGFPRLDLDHERELVSADFRFGVPFTFARNGWEYKFGYYHLSSHLGDEFLVRNPGYMRINYSRDVLVAAVAYRPTDTLRLYAEAGYAFYDDVSEPWEFQFGVDYAPGAPTGCRGAPFAAFNGHLRQELDFSGNAVVQAGWAWRGGGPGHLFRVGVEYVNGKSTQFEFFNRNEEQIGAAMWFDY